MSNVDAFVEIVAVWPHAGAPAELVRALKYQRSTAAVTALADAMAAVAPAADLVTWLPASRARRRRRGFDQSELLARAVARRLALPTRRLLRRVDDEPQTARTASGRALGPRLAPRGKPLRAAPVVMVVDDVVTSGASLRRAAAVLCSNGAGAVKGLVATSAGGTEGPTLSATTGPTIRATRIARR